MTRFDTDAFVEACREAARDTAPLARVRSLVARAVAALAAHDRQLEPLSDDYAQRGNGIPIGRDRTLFEDDDVTVVIVETEPGHEQPAHDHGMSAVIGVFEGAESNRFFRRVERGVALATRRVVHPGEVIAMRASTVHAIGAEGAHRCRALHVYLGRLSTQSRTLYHPDTGVGEALDFETYLSYVRGT